MAASCDAATRTISATKPTCRSSHRLGSSSRAALLAGSGIFTIALFLLDCSALQVQGIDASSELTFYLLGFLATLVYVKFVSQGKKTPNGANQEDKVSLAEAVSAAFQKARSSAAWLYQQLECPTPQVPRPAAEHPPVSFRWLALSHVVLLLAAVVLFVPPFFGPPEAMLEMEGSAFLDAPPPRCEQEFDGSGKSKWTWLVFAFTLSSGLCVVHPLQSGLIVGF
eukprot:TRINITY_DN95466_c0_g1_i1.p1 TRINITY_DN95466_c0_g1~~TRINITY_DN95466_c0_g1_i1.p1  ORF type:complete len:224 (-),score=56.29 TRINITY_DN95466_c0_g1_i1:46-717(-)